MKRLLTIAALCCCAAILAAGADTRRITYREYLDKVHGGWIGKIAGVALGVPKEFAEPWPPSEGSYFAEVPTHFSDQYSGDDLYFPLLAQACLKKYGTHPTYEQYMTEWKNMLFTARVWEANSIALEHYFAGILPPKTGYPGWNGGHDIDAQIGFDNIGWVAPGLPNKAARMVDEPAHVMSWGDGADGAVFVAAAISEAFFSSDPEQVIKAGESVPPAGSAYREMIGDVLRWQKENKDWRITRQLLAQKYNRFHIGEALNAPIRPLDVDRHCDVAPAEAKMYGYGTRRRVSDGRCRVVVLLAVGCGDRNFGADAIAIEAGAGKVKVQPMVRGRAPVQPNLHRSAEGSYHNVEPAIAIEIRESSAAMPPGWLRR